MPRQARKQATTPVKSMHSQDVDRVYKLYEELHGQELGMTMLKAAMWVAPTAIILIAVASWIGASALGQ